MNESPTRSVVPVAVCDLQRALSSSADAGGIVRCCPVILRPKHELGIAVYCKRWCHLCVVEN